MASGHGNDERWRRRGLVWDLGVRSWVLLISDFSILYSFAHGSGVVSSRCVIEFGLTGGVNPPSSSSVGEVDGGQSRVLIV